MSALCRDCFSTDPGAGARCEACGGARVVRHAELFTLATAHVDCDAFYAAVEKRDRPELRARPLIVGGGQRGVVTTACYLARIKGVRSAMPMTRARALCPEAAIVKPDMARYAAVSAEIRRRFDAMTPVVEPLSLDEAYLDLAGLEALHRAPPALVLARLAAEIEAEVGVSISVGLAANKAMAKIASELDKPRGFAVIGRDDAPTVLAEKPLSVFSGVGPVAAEKLARLGLRTVADLRACPEERLARALGGFGSRLKRLAEGEDARPVRAGGARRSVSTETTFSEDLSDEAALDGRLWLLAERLSGRMKEKGLATRALTLTVKTARRKRFTRTTQLGGPSDLADAFYRAATPLLAALREGSSAARPPYRLMGLGAGALEGEGAAESQDLFGGAGDALAARRAAAERAMDKLRRRYGDNAVKKGRALKAESRNRS